MMDLELEAVPETSGLLAEPPRRPPTAIGTATMPPPPDPYRRRHSRTRRIALGLLTVIFAARRPSPGVERERWSHRGGDGTCRRERRCRPSCHDREHASVARGRRAGHVAHDATGGSVAGAVRQTPWWRTDASLAAIRPRDRRRREVAIPPARYRT